MKLCRSLMAVVCMVLVIISMPITAQAASELFISEYVEGSGLNKAIEIYNDTGAAVDLSTYELQYYFNGNTSAGRTLALTGTLVQGDTYVIAEDAADPVLRSLADQLDTSTTWFNGDDAVVLLNGGVVVDAIGQIGFDPGSQWGSGDISTADNTIRRKSSACQGDSDAFDAFDPAAEWDGYPQNTFDGIGIHSCSSEPPPAPDNQFIHLLQGSGASSPLNGQLVTVEAIVIADFQGNSELKGFFVQEEESDYDSDPLTSEGIFVYDAGTGIDVNVGDLVQVTGIVGEYFNMTQLSGVTVQLISSNNPLPSVIDIDLPLPSADFLERHEGMLVHLPQVLSVTENYNLGRYGEVWLSSGGRLMAPTNVATPGAAALAQQAANDLNRILLDDFSTVQNPDPVIFPVPSLSAFNTLRSGDTVSGITGALNFAFSFYRVQPTQVPNFVASNSRSASPQYLNASLKIASFNVLNYFNGDGQGGGFPTARGASSLTEFNRQRDKIVAAISAMNADVIGLMEIENDGYGANSAIQDLVNGLNTAAPNGVSYAFINPGVSQIGTDEIAVGIIYRLETVNPIGNAAILDSSIDTRFLDTRNRPVLAQTFDEIASGGRLTISVNHLKSKGSVCDDVGDPDMGDGQGNCNQTRTLAAQALVDWLATDPTASNDSDYLIIGDLNSYAKEDPITAIKSAGYTDMIDVFLGSSQGYSYVFEGQSGYLDHALASSDLVAQVAGLVEWHINADEPRALDYNVEFKSASQVSSFYNPDPYRASDHDPVIIGLNLTVPAPVAQSLQVADLDGEAYWVNSKRWEVTIVINVKDDLGEAVSGATVTGTWTGSGTQADSCVTDIDGNCSVSRQARSNIFSQTFTVDAISHSSLSYDPLANTDPDSDSNGTSITLSKALRQALFDWLVALLTELIPAKT